nr:nucleoside-diphosphate sugar epimerase/dehydratase [uncultured Tolumonas sp.]
MLTFFNTWSRAQKRLISVAADCILISIAYWGAFWVRLDTELPIYNWANWALLGLLIPVSITCFIRIGLYRAVLRYVSFRVFWTITLGMTFSTIFLVLSAFYFSVFLPRTVSIIYFTLAMLLIGGVRLVARNLINATRLTRIPVIIYGAGAAGRQLQRALYQGLDFYPVAFIDDDLSLQGLSLYGLSVNSPNDLARLISRHHVEKILLAMPSCSRKRRQDIINSLESFACEVLTIPGMDDLVNGRAKIDQLNEVTIEDLLGRDAIEPITELMSANIQGKNVMVTGAGGSIGSELCRQIVRNRPRSLVLFELSEFGLYSIERELKSICSNEALDVDIIPLLGSVQRQHRLQAVMTHLHIQTVYHAAAYKHVPLVEYNVVEGVRNNIFGTLFAAQAAIESGVETFVLISTDKAVRPTNTMGATKRLAELVLQALSKEQSRTRFCMVRFGNVLGSSGSVVPLFRQQILKGGPVTVTHPDIIRYFMTIPEASQLVIQAGAMGVGGDVFVLDMGKPVKIIDLAHRMIRLSGLTVRSDQHPHGDINIEITGLRPGEKLFEELLIGDEVSGTAHQQIMTANEVMLPWSELRKLLIKLDVACHNFDHEKIRELLLRAPAAFNPTDEICDLVWLAKRREQQPAEPNVKHNIEFIVSELVPVFSG